MLKTTNSDFKSLVHQKRDDIISIATKHGAYNIRLLEIQNDFSIKPPA